MQAASKTPLNPIKNPKKELKTPFPPSPPAPSCSSAPPAGSRIHVFKFKPSKSGLQLLGDTFEQLKPGLSSFADDPPKAAASLKPLIDTALKTVPKELQVC
jgi:hypothetical protein